MKPIVSATAALAAAMLIAQPCMAAEEIRDLFRLQSRPAPYAGATFRLNFGGARKATPSLRLHAGMVRSQEDRGTMSSTNSLQVSALEVGVSREGLPIFYVAGQDARNLEQRLGIKGSTGKTLLIVGGVLVLVVVVGLMTSGGSLGPCTTPGC